MRMTITPVKYQIKVEREGDVVEGVYDPVTCKATGSLGRALSARPELAQWIRFRIASEMVEATVVFDDSGPVISSPTDSDFLGAFCEWFLYAKKEVGNWQNYKLVSPFGRAYYFAVNQATGRIGGNGLPGSLPAAVFDWLRGKCGFANSQLD